jgi:DNA-binding transcriptional regulator YiaG
LIFDFTLFGYCILVIGNFPFSPPLVVKLLVMKKVDKSKDRWDGSSIQALRRHLGLTQDELSEQLGTRQQTISEWETGMYQPRGASAKLLSVVAEKSKFKYDASLKTSPDAVPKPPKKP